MNAHHPYLDVEAANDVPTPPRASGTAAEWLSLAAAPTFAIMALLTGVLRSGLLDMLCSAGSPLTGMVAMYLLMSVFHSGPWLKLLSSRRNTLPGSDKPRRGEGR